MSPSARAICLLLLLGSVTFGNSLVDSKLDILNDKTLFPDVPSKVAGEGGPTRQRQLQSIPPTVTTSEQLYNELLGSASEIVIGASLVIKQLLPTVKRNLTIRGSVTLCKKEKNKLCILRAQYKWRHLRVNLGGRLTLRTLELRNGRHFRGASVYVTGASYLLAEEVEFGFNLAYGVLYGGGAIEADGGSQVVARNCTFRRNTAGFGGAIDAVGGSKVTVAHSLFHRNAATVAGGAVSILVGGEASITGGQFSRNTASTGGAVFVRGGAAQICNIAVEYDNSVTVTGQEFVAARNARIGYCGLSKGQFGTQGSGKVAANCTACTT